nr:putative disease resistance protein RGA3 [Coffea arabica]
MADALIGATIQIILQKMLPLAADGIGMAFGLKEDLKNLRESAAMIRAVIADAEEKQGHDQAVKLWLKRLEGVAFDADNVLDELNYEFIRKQLQEKVCFFSFFCDTALHWRMASKVKNVNQKLKIINQEAIDFGLRSQLMGGGANIAPLPLPAISRETDSIIRQIVVGRSNDASNLVETLLSSSAKVVSVIPISGMGGLGKTTLAQLAYNDPGIDGHFDTKIWICVSEKFEVTRLFKLVLESLTKRKVKTESRDVIVQDVRKELKWKRYLIVLDDMWDERSQLWDDFFQCLVGITNTQGNWILVTTRKLNVASIVATHPTYRLEILSDDDCWSILIEKAFGGGEVPKELEEVRTGITKRCQGLPLAANVIGGLLRIKRKEEWLPIIESGLLHLSENENTVMQLLKLSFDHLPTASIKKCFAYCSILDKDFLVNKQHLIQLWMAEGFLQASHNELLEDIGNNHYHILLESSLLQEVRMYDPYLDVNARYAKMHDFVYDLARSLSGSDSIRGENCQSRYLVLHSFGEETQMKLNDISTSVSSLILLESHISGDILSNFRYLHVLKLSWVTSEVLPSSIGKLIHLRFLDLSYSRIEALPESICKLYNLQTLTFDEYPDKRTLKQLPKGMRKLVNLRHLRFFASDGQFQMPKGMRQLTCLQTLQFFNVGKDNGRTLEELGCLKNLRGRLQIRNLELVNGKEGALQADLLQKPKMRHLGFEWCSVNAEGGYDDEHVLEGLQPHPNLQSLHINNYNGGKFPRWLMNMAIYMKTTDGSSITRLDKLVKLRLINCKLCTEVPALGQLPSLQVLELNGLENLRCIGTSFYCIADDSSGSSSNRSSSQGSSKLFPALKTLELANMPNLVQWRGAEATSRGGGDEGLEVFFPSLEDLMIMMCPKLTTAPGNFPSLKRLKIERMDQLLPVKQICSNATILTDLWIKGMPELTCIQDVLNKQDLAWLRLEECPYLNDIHGCGTSLRELRIMNCENLRELPENLHQLQALQTLCIMQCPNIKSIAIPSGEHGLTSLQELRFVDCSGLNSLPAEMLHSRTSLCTLVVRRCPNLVSFPIDLQQTPSLVVLVLSGCPKLTTIPEGLGRFSCLRVLFIGPFPDSSQEFELLSAVASSSVRTLAIVGWPHSNSLPEELQYLTNITKLSILNFGSVEALPDWLGNLGSLERLHLIDCEKLQHLPSMAAMRRLTKLSFLSISGCPLLQELCSNSERFKISHIPTILIDDEELM